MSNSNAVWRAMNSEYADRLVEIAVEHTRLAKELITMPHGIDAEIIDIRISKLRMESDEILELFENEDNLS